MVNFCMCLITRVTLDYYVYLLIIFDKNENIRSYQKRGCKMKSFYNSAFHDVIFVQRTSFLKRFQRNFK